MKLPADSPVDILLGHLDYIESLVDCLELVACGLRDEYRHTAADAILLTIRDQRFQAMLVRGQLAAW